VLPVCVIKCAVFVAIFGQSLDATMSYEQERNPGRQVPEIVELCCEFIRSNGMNLEGLFRYDTVMLHFCMSSFSFDMSSKP
jgi:hypothetical protein